MDGQTDGWTDGQRRMVSDHNSSLSTLYSGELKKVNKLETTALTFKLSVISEEKKLKKILMAFSDISHFMKFATIFYKETYIIFQLLREYPSIITPDFLFFF